MDKNTPALNLKRNSVHPASLTHFVSSSSPLEFACFLVFWFAQLTFVWKGIDGIRKLEKYSAPILVALTSCLLIWSCVKAGGIGHMLSLSSRLSTSEFSEK